MRYGLAYIDFVTVYVGKFVRDRRAWASPGITARTSEAPKALRVLSSLQQNKRWVGDG